MKVIDTRLYISTLREIIEQGKEVNLLVAGNSMSPFIIHQRDYVFLKKPDRPLKKGDIVFFQRDNGDFILHRICRVKPEGYYIVGDAQLMIEGPVRPDQIFAIVTKVKRKTRLYQPGDFWWEFFEHVWIHLIPCRRIIIKIYGVFKRIFSLF